MLISSQDTADSTAGIMDIEALGNQRLLADNQGAIAKSVEPSPPKFGWTFGPLQGRT